MVPLGFKNIFTNWVGQCEGYPWNVSGEAHTCYDLAKIKSLFRWCSPSGCSHLKKFAFQLRHHPGTTGNPTHWSRGSDPKWALELWHFWVMGGGWLEGLRNLSEGLSRAVTGSSRAFPISSNLSFKVMYLSRSVTGSSRSGHSLAMLMGTPWDSDS